MSSSGGLNVIALVSGGKDSFFSLLHCRANGHRIIALANLHPARPREELELELELGPSTSHPPAATISAAPAASAVAVSAPAPVLVLEPGPGSGSPQGPGQPVSHAAILPDHHGGAAGNELVSRTNETDEDEHDLNSFMYQTVGHQVIPLYAEATGIPLYRQAITGGAAHHGKDYFRSRRSTASAGPGEDAGPPSPDRARESGDRPSAGRDTPPGEEENNDDGDPDETESMIPLLRAIKKAHPEANAVCAGAILSTYQRTRVESVALRLGLTPLAYLWKFPALPAPSPPGSGDAQLLDDMAAVGLEARIIKVASGGLDDSFLWTNVASPAGKGRLARAMRRFGAAETGAVIGEGGEFETLVLDGPPTLFRRRIVVAEEDRRVVREGGGSAWLSLRGARLGEKKDDNGSGEGGAGSSLRVPDLLDSRFATVLDVLSSPEVGDSSLDLQSSFGSETENPPRLLGTPQASASERLQQWSFVGSSSTNPAASIEAETRSIVHQIRQRLQQHALLPSAILHATVLLRGMADFPAVNAIYATLFDGPNPPSRVTISCGDALSSAAAAAAAAIAVHLTVHTAATKLLQQQPGLRQGLHVQSRSYWAPANIGPYSQAISVPLASLSGEGDAGRGGGDGDGDGDVSSGLGPGSVRLVSVAGQIPLVPATMALPSLLLSDGGGKGEGEGEGGGMLRLQLALSLQHLWRIGAEVGVQWWSSAVAYFPASASASASVSASVSGGEGEEKGEDMAAKARLASRAWRAAHISASDTDGEEDDEEDENGPDLWDRRYNPEYMTFAGGDGGEKTGPPALPDRSVLGEMGPEALKGVVPPLFVAEVDELPRGAGVEWHAHLGVACAGEGSVQVREMRLAVPAGEGKEMAVSQVIVGSGEGGGVRFVQTVVAEVFGRGGRLGGHGQVARAALGQLGGVASAGEPAAVLRYVDAGMLGADEKERAVGPMVPCRSLWDGRGERLAAVTVYQSVFE